MSNAPNIVIRAEHLGKKFRIAHRQAAGQYTTLGDTITQRIRSLVRPKDSGDQQQPGHSHEQVSDFWALKDINFEICKGEAIGIVGRNGAGKSTLLKILSKITEPTTGRITIKGRIASLLEVGTGFHPELTGRENIYLNGAILGMKRSEIGEKFKRIVEFAEIDEFLDTPVKRYSSGMYMRLAFSVAAHLETDILLIDEVLAVGDAMFQRKCLGTMEDITKQGRTILFVSHNMSALAQFCEKGMLIKDGTIAMSGDIRQIIDTYLSPDTHTATVELAERDLRGPCVFSRIRRIALSGSDGLPRVSYSMGETLVAEISVAFSRPVRNVEIGLRISTMFDQVIHLLTSSWEGVRLTVESGEHRFLVTMPNISLLPGHYLVGAWVSLDGEWSDTIAWRALSFEVISHDVTGYLTKHAILNTFDKYATGQGTVYAPSRWQLVSTSGVPDEG